MIITHKDVIYQLMNNPLIDDPNYNKSLYHVYMGSKIMSFAELLIFSYDVPNFVKNLNDFFRFLIQYSTVIEEFQCMIPITLTAIKYIRTNPIQFSEQTDGFQLSRKLLDNSRYLKDILYTPLENDIKNSL